MNEKTVCAVVVTYNRKELLIECLEALEHQTRPLDAIYIIDNDSTDETPELLKEKGYINKIPPTEIETPLEKTFYKKELPIHYVRMHENTGGAGGFHEGVKRAYEKGYNWIWLMDDDVEPYENCLDKLLQNKTISKVLVPLKISKKGEIDSPPNIIYNLKNPFLIRPIKSVTDKFKSIDEMPELIEIQDFSFEGPLINRSIIKDIGYPRKDLFYYGDDTDYSLKITQNLQKRIILVKCALMVRKINTKMDNTINWKSYYILRNTNFIFFRYGKNILVKIKPLFLCIAVVSFNLIKLNFDKKKIFIVIFALIDSWKKKLPLRYKPN